MEEWIHVCRLDKFIGLMDELMDGWIDGRMDTCMQIR